MTRFDVKRMVEDVEECLNKMQALPGIMGYKHGCCIATMYSGFISVEFRFCSTDDEDRNRIIEDTPYLDESK